MIKNNLFELIIQTVAEVCCVSTESIIGTNRSESVVIARSITVFYCTAFGLTVSDILPLIGRTNANSINSIKARTERLWCDTYSYHLLVKEAGEHISHKMSENGEEFDYKPFIRHIQNTTGKMYYR